MIISYLKTKSLKLIEDYLYSEKKTLKNEVLNLINSEKLSVLKRKSIGDRILNKVVNFVETFMGGMDN